MNPGHPEIPPRILVVEDESLVRMVAVDILEDAGLPVAEAPDAEAALRLIEAEPDAYGTLFTDIEMPGSMNGLDLADRVHRCWPHIRLVVTSGRIRPCDDDIPDAGRFLCKPYRQADLLDVLRPGT